MSKVLLSLGLLAALAVPAAAGRLDDADPSVRQTYTAPVAADVDYTTTSAITAPAVTDHFDKQRGEQGAYFGANGR